MSVYGSYLERARAASSMLSSMEMAAGRRPADLGLRLNVLSARKIAERAERELEQISAREHIDICRYRMVVSGRDSFSVKGVSRSLDTFQEMFTFVYDAIEDAPKNIARLPRDRRSETALEFGYTFAGSLGVVLVAPGQLSLFGGGKFDDALDAINAMFDISAEDGMRDAARRLGKAAIQKVFEWSNANFGEGFDVDLKWLTPSSLQKGRYVPWIEFERVVGLIGRTSDKITTDFSTHGTLVGFSSVARTFHFVVPDGDSFKGQLAEAFPADQEWTINHPYAADLSSERTTTLATGDDVNRYRLHGLRDSQIP